MTITTLSIVMALLIGTIQLLQVAIEVLKLEGPMFDFIGGLDFGILGYVIVGFFLVAWGVSALVWNSAASRSATVETVLRMLTSMRMTAALATRILTSRCSRRLPACAMPHEAESNSRFFP